MNPPLNILIAEDEQSVAFSLFFALKPDGHRIEMVSGGEEALAKLIAEPDAFDLLITDNNMPRMTGVELVRRLRETAFRGNVLIVSAHLSPENRAAYDALGVDGMIPKPFDLHQLRDVISRIAQGRDAACPGRLKPIRLSPEEVHNLLRSALLKADDPEEPMGLS